MSLHLGVVANQFVIDFHLFERRSVRIMHEVKPVASWCLIPENSITFIVLKYQMNVILWLLAWLYI